MNMRQLQTVDTPSNQVRSLKAQLQQARLALRDAEADLAEEQAAVNRFRMHCRLKIGDWVEQVAALRSEKQDLLTRLNLVQDFGDSAETFNADELILPTDVPQDKSAEKRLYKQLAKRFHPDLAAAGAERAYATSLMTAINTAYQAGDIDALRDFAGELDPEMVARWSGGDTREIEKLRKHLLACKRRQRKVARQAQTLRKENTARLWRKAQQLDERGINWWDAVRLELERESARLQPEIDKLRQKLQEHV